MTSVEDGVYKCHHHRSDHHHNHHHRKRRNAISPSKFHTMVVMWHVVNFSTKLPKDVQLSVFKEAFDKWHDVSRLNFSYTANVTKAHIKIRFFLKGTVVYCTCSNCWIVSEAQSWTTATLTNQKRLIYLINQSHACVVCQ
jgi:hypothetical protein